MVEMKVTGLTVDPFSNAPVLLLRNADNTHTLPIWVGILEASAIASVLEKLKFFEADDARPHGRFPVFHEREAHKGRG